ncbi:DUF4377 domain-containing protein [Lysobacter sp. GCM10012299]|uniref:DUF4377 domain-containing protein n=1 Tax=Lysobacter sp. GCM10012299 TaxID=3317333 RepID=UPI0036240690
MNRLMLLALPLALAACAKAPTPPEAATPTAVTPPAATTPAATPAASTTIDAAALGSQHWKLEQAVDAKGQRIDALFARADKPLQLDFRDGRVSVSNACNRMGGGYTLTGDRLQVARMAATLMACTDPKLMALDQAIGKRLEAPQTVALRNGDQLALTSADGEVLTFRGEPTAETRYGGPGETAFLEVAAQTKPCSHPLIPNKQCLQVRELRYDDRGIKTGTPGEWQPLYQDIEGYEHTDGVRNVVRVKRYTIKNPPADGSSIAYVLDMVVESENVAASKKK